MSLNQDSIEETGKRHCYDKEVTAWMEDNGLLQMSTNEQRHEKNERSQRPGCNIII